MELKFAILADLVNETREGKLNIIGTFDMIRAAKIPAVHPSMSIAARFEASVSEGTGHELRVGVYDVDGKAILPMSPSVPMVFTARGPGRTLICQTILRLDGAKFPRFGDYEVHLHMDGRIIATIPLSVVRAPTGKEPHGELAP